MNFVEEDELEMVFSNATRMYLAHRYSTSYLAFTNYSPPVRLSYQSFPRISQCIVRPYSWNKTLSKFEYLR